ncbi:alpha/beta hydrolase [Planotetraspora kaengkrachanensis]|uniref:Esterase n=1 Tax=Planotetraspora kaengkrachanensis TaxID=575193 RepID=A0A8J3V9P2_9ACTN|nr:alpha/beta hydrolase [Planotetraspora kaengkrachanensis]GIG82693.1 esterase [Planotetraspora kaengkrachanensis]
MTPPIGYLTAIALTAICVVLALRPINRPWSLAYLSFRIGIVINELSIVVLYWILASTALALGQGSIDAPGAWPAVVVAGGLAVVVRRGLRTGPAVDHALTEALGNGWRAAADAGRRPRLPLLRILFLPVPFRPRDVERHANISYGDAGRRNLLDVYRHRSRPSGGPVLIHLHGGGFYSGRKNSQSLPLIHRLARRGWVCISANYRLRPAAQFPDHLVDLKKIIAWAREHAHEYGADPSTIFVSGSSAGGHLSSMAALTPNDPAFQPGFEHADTSVTAVVSLNGWYGNYYGQGPESSPLAYVRQDAPPFFIAHGDRDSIADVEGARLFAGKLRSTSSAPVVYAELPGAQHAFDLFHSLRFERVVDGVEAFAAWVLAHR